MARGRKRRRRTRSDEPGGRTDLDDGIELWSPPRGPFAAYGDLWRIASRREPGYRGRLYSSTLPYVLLTALALVIILGVIALILLAINAA